MRTGHGGTAHLMPVRGARAGVLAVGVDVVHAAGGLAVAIGGHQLAYLVDDGRVGAELAERAVRGDQRRGLLRRAVVHQAIHVALHRVVEVLGKQSR